MTTLNLSFLIPLTLIVIVALAEVAREVDIRNLSTEVHDDVFLLHGGPFERLLRKVIWRTQRPGESVADYFSWGSSENASDDEPERLPTEPDGESDATPTLGRFNHLHGFNTFLLAVLLVLTALERSDLTGFILSIVVTVFWINLPAIETNEYDAMLRTFEPGDPLNSLSFHTVAIALVSIPLIALAYIDISSYSWQIKIGGAGVFILVNIFIANVYQSFLDNELQLLESKKSDKSH